MITLYQVIYSQHLHSPTHAPGWTSSINTARPTHPCLREHRAQVQDTTSRKHEEAVIWAWYGFDHPWIKNCRNLPTTRETRSRWYVEKTYKLSNYEKKKREGRITIRNRKTSSRSRWGGALGCGDMRLLLFLPSIACIWAWEHWCHCLKLRPLVLRQSKNLKHPMLYPHNSQWSFLNHDLLQITHSFCSASAF